MEQVIFRITTNFSMHSDIHGFPCSLAGSPEVALANIQRAVRSAYAHEASSVVVSHWAGISHVPHFSMVWPGLLMAAGLTWNKDSHIPQVRCAQLSV